MVTRRLLAVALCVGLCAAFGALAASDTTTTDRSQQQEGTANYPFDSRIDTWVEGTITALDAENQKFTVRGHKLAYASEHAEMMKDIADKTANLSGDERRAKALEVRRNWQDRLNKARNQEAEKDSEYTFNMPSKGKFTVLPGTVLQRLEFLRGQQAAAGKGADEQGQPTAFKGQNAGEVGGPGAEQGAQGQNLTLKDLKVGERLFVGFDSGVVNNEAYTAIRAGQQSGADRTGDQNMQK